MVGKEEKKKQLKTLITFHSPEVYERAVAELNTSALGEALFARHFNIEIAGDTVQAQLRRMVLDDYETPYIETVEDVKVAGPLDDVDDADGDIEDGPLILPQDEPALALPELPKSPGVETAPIISAPVEELLPDRPVEETVEPSVGFEPIVEAETPLETVVQHDTTDLIETQYAPGTRVCPECGRGMGSDPYCLTCL